MQDQYITTQTKQQEGAARLPDTRGGVIPREEWKYIDPKRIRQLQAGVNDRYTPLGSDLQVTPVVVNLMEYSIRAGRHNAVLVARMSDTRTLWDVRYRMKWYRVIYKSGEGIISFATPNFVP